MGKLCPRFHVSAMTLDQEVRMGTVSRRRIYQLECVAMFSLLSAFCTDSQAQNGPWMLGVRTETISIRRFTPGDPVGAQARYRPSSVAYVLRITDVIQGSAAEKAGLEVGDRIGSVNGESVTRHDQLVRAVKQSNGVVTLWVDNDTRGGIKIIDLRGTGATGAAGGEIFISHIGIYYEKLTYQDGTFGARLTRNAVANSPAAQLRIGSSAQLYALQKGDTIFEMDGQRFRTEDDARNHRFETTMRFINKNTGQTFEAALTLP
jgi:S1-C subfamily serine protease